MFTRYVLSLAILAITQSPDARAKLARSDTSTRPLNSVIVRAKSQYLNPSKWQSLSPTAASAPGARSQFLAMIASFGVREAKQLWPNATGLSSSFADPHPGTQTFVVETPSAGSAEQLAQELANQPWVEYAEVDRLVELHEIPNDPLWSRQWDLRNTGQAYWSVRGVAGDNNDSLVGRVGVAGADLRFLAAYESNEPTANVLVGVIDTGVDTLHVDLQENLARNNGELPGNALDDDHNGFIDDVFGWDFSGDESLAPIEIVGDNDIADYMGHGTHVAGTIAATVNNGIGIAGVCPHARIIGVKIFPNPYFSISAAGIYYAVDRGVRVINMSWGGSFRSRAIEDALQYAHDRGVVLVASMGNSGRDEVFFPSGYTTTMGVGSSNARDQLSHFSTYNDFIDVVAPGEDILSLRATGVDLYADIGEPGVHIIDERYLIASGTSMSSPHVAGAAAVLLSYAPGLSNKRVREILRASADDIVDPFGNDSLSLPGWDRHTGAGRVNLERALAMLPGVLLEVTSHERNARVAGSDVRVAGRALGRNFQTLHASLAPGHPPYAMTWVDVSEDRIVIDGEQFQIDLRGIDTLAGPYTLRLDAGPDAVIDWPLWFGNYAVARIELPLPGDTVRLMRPILGSAYAPRFTRYSLAAVGPLPAPEDHHIAISTTLGWNDTLAYWRTDSLESGVYDLILAVTRDSIGVDTIDIDSIVVDTIALELAADTVRVVVRDAFLEGFPVDLPATAHFAVATVNLDGVGGEEIICPTQNGLYVLQSNGQIYPGWPRAKEFDVRTAPAVADLDRDGKYEIIVASGSYMHVYAFIGEAFAGWPQEFNGGHGIFGNSMPVVGDVDGLGGLEVGGIDRNGNIKIWHADGTEFAPRGGPYFARIDTDRTFGAALPRLAICDLDRDGRAEIIAAGDGISVFDALTGGAYADNDTSRVASHYSTHGLIVGDFNGDHRFDIAYTAVEGPTGRFSLHVIDPHGAPLAGWPREIPQRFNLYLLYSLSAGDIDADSRPELLFAPYSLGEGYLYAFHGNGAPVGSDSTNGLLAALPGTISPVVLANIDLEPAPEIVMRVGDLISGPDRIYAMKPDGQLLPGYPIIFGDGNSSDMPAPIIGDLNVDGEADMTTVQSTSMSIAVWELGTPATIRGNPWPRFSGDLWNSNIAPAPRYDVLYLVRMIDMIFHGKNPLPPYDPTDLNCDGKTDMVDITLLSDYLFHNGQRPCTP